LQLLRTMARLAGFRGDEASMVGCRIAGGLGALRAAIVLSSSPLLVYYLREARYTLALTAALLLALSALLPRIAASLIASGVDEETPSLILYLIPYAWSPQSIADLISRIASGSAGFRWMRLEARRLAHYLEWGLDPLSALQRLASTTRSNALREVLEEVVHSTRLGFPRSLLLSRLAERAMERLRSRWRSYSEAAKAVAEANAAIIVAVGVMAPLASLTGGSKAGVLPAAVIAPSLAALALAILQPAAGPGSTPLHVRLAPLLAGYASSALALVGDTTRSLVVLAAAALVFEAYGIRHSRLLSRALKALSEAARDARLGRLTEQGILRAAPLDRPVIEAVASSVRVAGTLRLWAGLEALESSYRAALQTIRSTRGQAILSAAVTLTAIAVSWYALGLIDSMASQAEAHLYTVPAAEAAAFMRAAAIAAGLAPGVLLRPRVPSLLPSLAMAAAILALSAAGLGPAA